MATATSARGQSAPVEVGSPLYTPFQIPIVNGSLHYSLTASDRMDIGYSATNETANFANFSGEAGYLSASTVHPFELTYSGGYVATTTGQPSGVFQNLSLSQTLNTKYWRFTLADSLRYLPESASAGFSGIPGVGDVGVVGTDNGQDILTPYATRVDNDVTLDVSRALTGKTSLNGTGYYAIERFLGPSGLESNDLSGRGALTHRINALATVSGDYTYSKFTYLSQPGAFESQAFVVEYTRHLTRRLEIGGGAGPEYIDSSSLTGRAPYYTYSVRAHLSYAGKQESGDAYSLAYIRSTNSGSGITFGAESDTLSGSVSRRFTRSLNGSSEVHYTQSIGLQLGTNATLDTKSFVASGQANRALSRTLSIFASYTFQRQIYNGGYQGLQPLNGVSQILGFGLTYSPTQIHLGRQ